jgi:hypothetical protein
VSDNVSTVQKVTEGLFRKFGHPESTFKLKQAMMKLGKLDITFSGEGVERPFSGYALPIICFSRFKLTRESEEMNISCRSV